MADTREEPPWDGGKIAGGNEDFAASVNARIRAGGRVVRRNFSDAECGGRARAREAATCWRREVSEHYGLVKNKYRVVNGVLQVQLTQEKVMLCDVDQLPVVEQYTWCARSQGPNLWYALSHPRGPGGRKKTIRFHSLITGFPLVDHINRDGLDNRRSNIHDATPKENANNRRKNSNNRSGIAGVYSRGSVWAAQWREDGRKITRVFSVAKYGDVRAKQLAQEARRAACIRVNNHNDE